MKKPFVFSIVLILIAVFAAFGWSAPYRRDPAEVAAEDFLQSIVDSKFDVSYRMLAEHARKTMIKLGIDRFSDLDNKYYLPNDMDYLLQTNVEGHRTVLFEDLRKEWLKNKKLTMEDLKAANMKPLKKTDSRAEFKFSTGKKYFILILKKEAGEWKAAWYPKL